MKPEEGASLARALGAQSIVVMRRHGATVVGGALRELVFRTIYSAKNAEHQFAAHMLGNVSPLTAGEAEMAGDTQSRAGAARARVRILGAAACRAGGRGKSDPMLRAAEAAARLPNPGAASAKTASGAKKTGAKKTGAKKKTREEKR